MVGSTRLLSQQMKPAGAAFDFDFVVLSCFCLPAPSPLTANVTETVVAGTEVEYGVFRVLNVIRWWKAGEGRGRTLDSELAVV